MNEEKRKMGRVMLFVFTNPVLVLVLTLLSCLTETMLPRILLGVYAMIYAVVIVIAVYDSEIKKDV